MTFKAIITLRNFMIILCICMLVLLGQKFFLIADKIQMTKEADRLYAAGDLIAAENQYRIAASNGSIIYMDKRVTERLAELSPITAIREGLSALDSTTESQAIAKDFTGFMKSYDSLLSLKATYMKPGGPYESYYRQLSAESGVSDKITAYFRQFKEQFLNELAQSQSSGKVSNEESFKWNLLKIPDAYYGSAAAKVDLLASKFKSHDTAKLKALAGAGNFSGMLESTLSMMNAYSQHNYEGSWVLQQAESSAKIILNKDIDSDNISAFAGHAVAYRNFAGSARINATKVLSLIESSKAKLLKNAKRMASKGQYAEAIQLYSDLAPLEDTSSIIAATRLAWNIAEPVRLLPGGEEQGKYKNVITRKGMYGTKVIVAGTDSNGVLYYAAINKDDSLVNITGDRLPEFDNLYSLNFSSRLTSTSDSGPLLSAESYVGDGRTLFTVYEITAGGFSQIFSAACNNIERQSDGSILVINVDLGDGIEGQNARYRKIDGAYQFTEIVQEYAVINASDVDLYPFQKVSFHSEIIHDNFGNILAYKNGVYVVLIGNVGSVTGNSLVSGQFQNGYQSIQTDMGEQYVPVFVVDSVGSMSLVY